MDNQQINRIVDSVLYEGYLLYPYRRAIKNLKRFTFGGIYPAESQEVATGAERSMLRARCLVVGPESLQVANEARFLHLIERQADGNDRWHESVERRVPCDAVSIVELCRRPRRHPVEFKERHWEQIEPCEDGSQKMVVRRQLAIRGELMSEVTRLRDDIYLLSVSIVNNSITSSLNTASPAKHNPSCDCGESLLQSFLSTHLLLHVTGGQFVSRIDPPEIYSNLCDTDTRDGLWPVLLGESGQHDTMLCSPIILYDYPQIAPESCGDYFDATEIDEMLTLRIMTLSDEEKRDVARLDERGRALLNRTQESCRQQLAKLHGTTRMLRKDEELGDER
jgi:hydrogenase maturation protease